jgi:hypothetical protein
MKLIKLASNGKVLIQLKTDKTTGEFKAEIVGHEDGATCGVLDEKILEHFMTAPVPGFGDLAEIEDEGKTMEYYEQQRNKMINQNPVQQEEDEEDSLFQSKEKEKGKDLDLGYGV